MVWDDRTKVCEFIRTVLGFEESSTTFRSGE